MDKVYSPERFKNLVKEFLDKEGTILNWKGTEYTSGVDRLQNFREIAAFLDMEPADVALMYMLKHVQGIKKQIQERRFVWAWEGESGEGLKQRFADVRNYLLLLAACLDEMVDESERREVQ